MNSFDSTYLVVTHVQHEEDMRRAAEPGSFAKRVRAMPRWV